MNLFENTRSTNTYTNMEAPTFQEQSQPNFLQQQQQQFQPNALEKATTSTLPSPLQEHLTGKKQKTRYSAELKAKILSQLENSSQADLARLYKIDRRLIRKWSKPANKANILNVVGKRHTFRIDGGNKSWWPELENELHSWFIQQRLKLYPLDANGNKMRPEKGNQKTVNNPRNQRNNLAKNFFINKFNLISNNNLNNL
jgi:hypothetical protein